MKKERQAILSLVATGRITPAEAERLLAAWNAGREESWMIAIAAAACFVQHVPALWGTWRKRGCRKAFRRCATP